MVRPKTRYLLLTGFILVCGVLLFISYFTGEEARINGRIELLRKTVSKNCDETELGAGIRARKIRQLFSSRCLIEAAAYDISKTWCSSEIGPSIMAARTPYSRIGIDIYDLHITEILKQRATVKFTVSVDLTPHIGPSITDMHEIECRLEKDNDKWLFSKIRTVNVLER